MNLLNVFSPGMNVLILCFNLICPRLIKIEKWKRKWKKDKKCKYLCATEKWWKGSRSRVSRGNLFHSYVNINFAAVYMFLCHNVFSDVRVGFVHFVPVPILMSPFSITSEHPYTMTLMPLEVISLVLTWVGLRHVNMRSLEKSWNAGYFWAQQCVAVQRQAASGLGFSCIIRSKVITGAKTSCKIIPITDVRSILVEEVNFEVTFLSLYEKLNPMQTLDHKRFFFLKTLVMPWIYENFYSIYTVAQFRFSTSSPSLTCRPLTSKHVANRRRSSRTGGVNSTPRLERKTSTGRTWREASTRWR